MKDSDYLIINKNALPDVYQQVIVAKELLASGEAQNITQATKMANISRAVYYKYKDSVFKYSAVEKENIITLKLKLKDDKGALSAVVNEIYKAGANVLSINQHVPNNSVADVVLTLFTKDMEMSEQELTDVLKKITPVTYAQCEKQSIENNF